jgi:putative ABC transport system permease protein
VPIGDGLRLRDELDKRLAYPRFRATLLALAGTLFGLIAAWNSSRLLATLLYGVKPTDLITLGVAATIVIAVSLVATYLLARRAARLDPIAALKRE